MRIIVGSTSEHKVRAVRQACDALGIVAAVEGMAASSGVAEQPRGWQDTSRGARNRAMAARIYANEFAPEAAISIGIESGIVDTGTVFLDVAIVMAWYGGRWYTATSPGIEFPREAVLESLRRGPNCTVGTVLVEQLGGSSTDGTATLTRGEVTREWTIYQGVLLALAQIPR